MYTTPSEKTDCKGNEIFFTSTTSSKYFLSVTEKKEPTYIGSYKSNLSA